MKDGDGVNGDGVNGDGDDVKMCVCEVRVMCGCVGVLSVGVRGR